MNITILNTTLGTAMSAKGKPYQVYEVAFKNNTFGGKVEGKKINQYSKVFKQIAEVLPGEAWDVQQEKNEGGFNEWVSMQKANGSQMPAPSNVSGMLPPGTGPAGVQRGGTPAPRSNFETPEERAKRQVYIIRQSSISSAIAALLAGAKSPPSAESIIELAKRFEAYVFGVPGLTGFEDIPDLDASFTANEPQID